jgi:hypothetical protein
MLRLFPAAQLCQAVAAGPVQFPWFRGQYGLIAKVPLDIRKQRGSGFVPPIAILLQRLHHDPVQFAAPQAPRIHGAPVGDRGQLFRLQRVHAGTRAWRFAFADDATEFVKTSFLERVGVEWSDAGQQVVEPPSW